eukprot:gene40326-49869_t
MNPPYDIIDAQRSNFDPRDDRYFNSSNSINSSLLSGDSVADRQAYGHVHSKPGSAKSVVNVDHRQQGVQSKIVATSVKAGLSELFGEQPTSPLPPSSMAKAAPSSVYEVAFKRLNSDYILHSRVVTPIAVGDLVVVSAERGCEDLGCVIRIRP